MKLKRQQYISFVFLSVTAVFCSQTFAQQREEFEQKKIMKLEAESLEKQAVPEKAKTKKFVLRSTINLSGGYDSNPRLTSIRKGDSLGNLKYSLTFGTALPKSVNLNLNYDFFGTAYSDFDQLSNLLNHVRISLDRNVHPLVNVGTGYDFSSFYYPVDKQSDYYFHKGFVYIKHNITKTIYHQITMTEGLKDYTHALGYLNSTSTFMNEGRRDYRHEAEYSLGLPLSKKTSFRMRTKFSLNDSNSLFQDYDDYKSVDLTPSVSYQILENLAMNVSFTATDKIYKERLVTNDTKKRKDWNYNVNLGFKYRINPRNSLSLDYGYSDSKSNDSTTEYTSNSIMVGYQFSF